MPHGRDEASWTLASQATRHSSTEAVSEVTAKGLQARYARAHAGVVGGIDHINSKRYPQYAMIATGRRLGPRLTVA